MKKITTFALLFALFFVACQKDNTVVETENPMTIIPTIPVNNVTASLNGQVVDESGVALVETAVRVGNQSFMTDENGFFYFKDVVMNELGTYIRFEKLGYFQAAKFVEPRAGMTSRTKAILLERNSVGTFQNSDGATVATPENASVTFSDNSIELESGGEYNGTVNVFAKWYDPTDADLLTTMPGDLRASNAAGEFVQLATYGMVAVELEGDNGESLNLIDGQTATLEFPVPTELLNHAPATIPLWYLNEATGYWIEEGTATLQGDKYVGEVSHFSFWNCDAPFPLVQLTGNLEDKFGNPISGYPVNILVNANQLTGGSYSDANGFFTGKVPKDEVLTIQIFDFCGNLIHEQVIGPFSEDVTLPTIQIEEGNLTIVYGTINDCDDNPLPNAYAHITASNFHGNAYANENGDFQITVPACLSGEEMQVVGYDLDSLKTSEIYTFDLIGEPFLNVEEISLCDELETFVNVIVEGESFVFQNPQARFEGNDFVVFADIDDDNFMYIYFLNTNSPGTYVPWLMNIRVLTSQYGDVYVECGSFTCEDEDISATINVLEGVGGFVEGNFLGVLPDGSTDYQVSGTFLSLIE